jgi:PAS domain S-box-containing protein
MFSFLFKKGWQTVTVREFITRFILFCILPLFLLALFLAAHHVYTLHTHQDQEAWNETRNVLLAIDRDLSARISALQVLASSPLIDDPPCLEEFYEEAQGFRESFTGHVVLADMSSRMLFNTRLPFGSALPKLPVPKGFAAAPHVLKTGRPAVGDMFLGPIAKEPLVAIVVPVVRAGKTKALLLSIIETRQYQILLDDLAFPEGYSVTLLDGKNAAMALRTAADFVKPPAGTRPGKNFAAKSKVAHWEVVLEATPRVYSKPLIIAGGGLLVAITLVALSSIVGGRLMGRRLARSIESLSGKQPRDTSLMSIAEIEEVRTLLNQAAADRELSMEKLRINEIRYRTLFEAANVGKSVTLPTGELNVNMAFCRMLGYEKDELQGKKWQELTPAEEVEPIQAILAQLLNGEKEAVRFEKRYIHRDGSYVWGDVSATIQRDLDGEPLYFITTVVDITKRKHTEAVLQESEEKYRLLFENMNEGFALHEIVTDEQGRPIDFRFLEINPAVERLTGLRRADIIGRCAREITTEPTWIEHYVVVALTGKPAHFQEYSSALKKWFEVFVFQPKPGLCAAVFSDITQRIKLENQMRQAQKMEAVGQLAGGVAHDYNNMLSVILGYTEMALENTDPASQVYTDLTEVLNAAKRSVDITRQLLAFARKQTIEPKVLNLNEAVEGLLKMLRRLIGEDLDLAWLPQAGLWSVNMDPSQIDQILVNLCVNGRDAVADAGKITIETGNITFDEAYCAEHPGTFPGNFIMLAVSDDGCGMNRETIDKIFEPFFTTKGLGRGTGLGLSTVYGIVKQNGGFINVYSEPGEGTTFKVYLPAHAGEAEDIRTMAFAPSPRAKGETILVVEDEISILQLAKRMLEELGYKVLTAKTPKKAISLAQTSDQEIHLLLTDVVMPEMNGRELAERIQAQAMHSGVKTLFMSGYTADVIAHHGVLEKGVHFVSKPLSRQVLAARVREALEG